MLKNLSGKSGISPLKSIFCKLSIRDATTLCGNAMHIPLLTMWIFWVMGNVRRIEDFCNIATELMGDDNKQDESSDSSD